MDHHDFYAALIPLFAAGLALLVFAEVGSRSRISALASTTATARAATYAIWLVLVLSCGGGIIVALAQLYTPADSISTSAHTASVALQWSQVCLGVEFLSLAFIAGSRVREPAAISAAAGRHSAI